MTLMLIPTRSAGSWIAALVLLFTSFLWAVPVSAQDDEPPGPCEVKPEHYENVAIGVRFMW